jgi:hypothetical protein
MATNIRLKVGGVYQDPDALFKPRANTGLKVGTQDFADRYYASTGGDTPGGSSSCYIKVSGSYVDVLSLFRAYSFTPTPPTLSVSGGGTYYVGASVTLHASVSGTDPIDIVWIDGPSGPYQTGTDYTFATVLFPTSATVTCEASNEGGSDSESVTVTWVAYPSASVSGSSTVASGGGGGGSWPWSVSAGAGIYRYRVYIPGHGGSYTYPSAGTTSASGSISWGSPMGYPDMSSTPGSYSWEVEVEDVNGQTDSASCPFTVV